MRGVENESSELSAVSLNRFYTLIWPAQHSLTCEASCVLALAFCPLILPAQHTSLLKPLTSRIVRAETCVLELVSSVDIASSTYSHFLKPTDFIR